MSHVRVVVDRETCLGSGTCAFEVPAVFTIDRDDRSTVTDPGAAPLDQLVAAARSCPTGSIAVFADGHQIA